MLDDKLKWAVSILMQELRIDMECLVAMANGYSPDMHNAIDPGSVDWKYAPCKVQLSQVTAQRLIDTGVNELWIEENESIVPKLLDIERKIFSMSRDEGAMRRRLLDERVYELHKEAADVVASGRPFTQLMYIYKQIGDEVFRELALTLPWNTDKEE